MQMATHPFRSTHRQLASVVVVILALTLGATGAAAQGAGYWHTNGNQILDSNNLPVRIGAINWYGFETTDQIAHGLWAQDYHFVLNEIKSNGYNTVRLPFSNQMVETPIIPQNFSQNNGQPINLDLVGLNALQVMDKIVAAAGAIGLRVILDNHRSNAGNSAAENGLWYLSGSFPESAWINDWVTLTNRYSALRTPDGNPVVIGMDLRNEPHLNANGGATGACWTGDTATGGCPTTNTAQNWPAAANRAGNAVLAANPNLLIIVEGAECYNGDCDWWGGNLEGVASNPVVLNTANRLVYSPHDYGPVLFQQSWFNSSTTFASLSSVWNKFWGYIATNNIAPVWLGEFGTGNNATDLQSSTPGSQGQWFQSLIAFLQNNSNLNWAYWAFNGEDSFALINNQYNAVANAQKQSLLATIQFPLGGGGGACTTVPGAPTGLAATAVSSSQINLSWNAVAPPANCAVTYSVFRSTANGFTPSGANQIASGLTSAVFQNTGLAASTTFFYRVEALDAAGASAPSAQVSATTQAGASCTAVPSAPAGLAASAISSSQINLTWTAVTPPANCTVTYTVFRSMTSGFTPSPANQVAIGLTVAAFSNTGLAASTAYFFRVQAVDAAGASASSAQATATTQSGGGTGGVTVTPVVASSSPWFNEEDIRIANTAPLTALSVTIVVQRTTGISFSGQYNTIGGQITQGNSSTASTVTYTFTLNSGQTLGVGSNWTFAAQTSGTGTAHPTAGDTYIVTYTTGGNSFSQTSHF